MRHRGTGYWLWTNTRLPFQAFEEVLGDGVQVEVRARISLLGFAQVLSGFMAAMAGRSAKSPMTGTAVSLGHWR